MRYAVWSIKPIDDIAAFKRARPIPSFYFYSGETNLTEVQVARFAVNQYRFPGVEVSVINAAIIHTDRR